MACANDAPPLLLPWTNVTVSKDGNAVARGIELGVGTPNQIFSLRSSIGDVNTWLFNLATCGSASNDSCIGTAGGAYDSQDSSTFKLTTQARWNGSQSVNEQGSFIYFNDEISFGSNGTAYGYPMFMDQPEQGSQGGLPLGKGSTFLEVAVNTSAAPSQAWGLWTGSRSIENPVDGLLVIGGYDAARVEGDLTTFNTFKNCPTCLVVTNITYDSVNGSLSLFSNSTETLEVALEPFQRSLELPQDIFDNFAQGSQVIPASELFSLSRLYDSDGVYSIINPDYIIAEVINYSNPKYVPDWGIPFLTMNYMIVDYDKGSFQMAPAIRTDFGPEGEALIKTLCTTPTSSPTPTSPAPSPMPPTSSPVLPHNHTGAIVGGVIGGVVGLALVAGLIFFILARRKRRVTRTHVTGPDEMPEKEKSSRFSMTTDATNIDRKELPSPQLDQHPTMGHWLSTQTAGEQGGMSPTVNAPFEMPVYQRE